MTQWVGVPSPGVSLQRLGTTCDPAGVGTPPRVGRWTPDPEVLLTLRVGEQVPPTKSSS